MALMTGTLASYAPFPVLVGNDGAIRWAHFKTKRSSRPTEIVLHYTAGGTFENNVYYLSKANERRVSAHLVVAEDGRHVLICPLDWTAWHAGNWDHNAASVGIELVHPDSDMPYPEPQLAATVELCKTLCQLFDIPPNKIIGHKDIVPTVCPRGLDVATVRNRVAGVAAKPPAFYKPPFIFGMHEPGGEWLMDGCPGWILHLCELGHNPNHAGGHDFTSWADRGFGTIARLQHGWGEAGTIPLPRYYGDYVRRVANFVAGSRGCNVWQLGNELNQSQEWPQGQRPNLDAYVQLYAEVRRAIKGLPGHADDEILPAPVAPWNASMGDWVVLHRTLLTKIAALCGPPDGISIHAYTHGHDPGLVTSNVTMDPPYGHRHYNFMVYADFMHAIPLEQRHLPVYITEIDANDPWSDVDNGFCQAVVDEIDGWNGTQEQKILATVFYRWPKHDQWYIEGKSNLHRDLRKAALRKHTWRQS